MLKQWHEAYRVINENAAYLISQPEAKIKFSDRWTIDVFAEYSMLICHILTEIEAYEIVETVGSQSKDILNTWLSLWDKVMPNGFFFSPKVLDFQLSSIIGWTAYSKYMISRDYATRNRGSSLRENERENEDILEQAKFYAAEAIKISINSPLAIHANALILNKQGHKAKAAEELNRLLSLISPFDPHVYSRRNSYIENYHIQNREISKLQSDDAHKSLIYGEDLAAIYSFQL